MSGFLRGWLGGESFATADLGNAAAPSRVAPALARRNTNFEELQFFLKHGSKHLALRKDEA